MTENNVTINNNLVYILSLFGNFLLFSILLIFYFSQKDISNYVYYKNCYQPVSDYAVEPGKTSNSILTTCGKNGQEKCTKNSTSLSDAVHFANSNNANKFVHNEKTGFTALLSSNKTNYYSNINSNIYTKQQQRLSQSISGVTKKIVKNETTKTAPSTTSVSLQKSKYLIPKINN